ncbi:hypothetical protein VTO42DRAFT_1307 [Malbranchea cinnamomea]
MSKLVAVTSPTQFAELLSSSTVVVVDFYADWCGPCKAIAPAYEGLAKQFSQPGKVTFAKINVDKQQEIAQTYGITAMPTFLVFKDGNLINTIRGADANRLLGAVKAVMAGNNGTASTEGESSSNGNWLGASVPKGYEDITNEIEIKGIDLLNCDVGVAPGKVLFETSKPSALNGKAKAESSAADWVESDTDEQLMIFMPFQSSLKIHSLHITSLPPKDEDEAPMRPKTLKLYTNRTHIIGFDEADEVEPTQTVEIKPEDWDEKTGTAKVELRFVKFQRVSSLVVYVVDGDGDEEKIRIDRIRILGEAGERREKGKLEKIGDEPGE